MSVEFSFYKKGTAEAYYLALWIAEKVGLSEDQLWSGYAVLGVSLDGFLAGAVAFHDYHPEHGTMQMTGAFDDKRAFTRPVLNAVHGYIFDASKCQLAIMRTSEYNATVRRQARALGYREHILPRLRGRDEADVMLTLTEEEWRDNRFNTTRGQHVRRRQPGST